MVTGFVKGYFKVISAFGKIGKYGLWFYLFLSGIISTAIGGSIYYLASSNRNYLERAMVEWYPFEWGADWIASATGYLSSLLAVVLGLYLYKYIVLAVVSPLMSFVSEKVERHLVGKREDGFSITRMIGEFIRGIRVALGNMFKELFYVFILFLIGVIVPVIGPVVAVVTFLVQAYYAGYSSLDYFMERRFDIAESNEVVRQNKWWVIGVGSGFLTIILIPFLGWIFAPMCSAIAATEIAIDKGLDDSTIYV